MKLEEKQAKILALFVNGHYPYSKVVSGELLIARGIELTEICRTTFQGGLKYRYDDTNKWLGARIPLTYGGNTGWNVTEDCMYALCRVNYDDYINFSIKFIENHNSRKEDIEKFWIRCLLGSGDDWLTLSINRAYRDLNRTIHGLGEILEIEKNQIHSLLVEKLKSIVETITSTECRDQQSFDNWHKSSCDSLIELFNNSYESYKPKIELILTYGQAQKWINMSLKYLYALGEEKHIGISRNFEFYHIPIDNIIQEKVQENVNGLKVKWSKLNDYEEYLRFQNDFRNWSEMIPLEKEFKLFNES